MRYYVPALQPSLRPLVFHVALDPRAIVAIHHGRHEREVVVDVRQALLLDHTTSPSRLQQNSRPRRRKGF
jgi:hypothetical protein